MRTIPVVTCKDVIEASFITNELALVGIKSFTTNENVATLFPYHFMSPDSGIKIFINEEDLEKARKVLELDD